MWETPIYKFQVQKGSKKEDIFIDVTGSAPNFDKPMKQLEGTLKVALSGLEPSETKILDFGAAKLRNTLHLLKQGYIVYACEYNDLFLRSKQADDYYKEAKKYKNFKLLVFPHDFINKEIKFDVALLINVLNIMPIHLERLCALALCRDKMKDTGRLLWYTQHGAYPKPDKTNQLFDGIITGMDRKYKMFYRDFSRDQIHEMLMSTGFTFDSSFKFPMSGTNQAYLFNSDGPVLVNKTLHLIESIKKASGIKLSKVERKAGNKRIKKYLAKVPQSLTKSPEVKLIKNLADELKGLRPGKKDAYKYQGIILALLDAIFKPQLIKFKKEDPLHGDLERIDITCRNKAKEGFFSDLDSKYHVYSPYIFIECKNYSGDLSNTEYGQIRGRLAEKRGMFGVIICRKIDDEAKALAQCVKIVGDDKKYVIILTDKDITDLVKYKIAGDEDGINGLLDDKLNPLFMA